MGPASSHAFGDDVLGHHDAVALAELVRNGDLSAEEVIASAIARAETVEPSISAIVVDCFDQALARSAEPLHGAFAGVPTFIKDQTDVTDLPTRYGSAAFHRASAATKTHPVAQQHIDMGMVCLGKSTMPEFGFTPSAEFPDGTATRNPWNLDRSPGGSSSGSAALVAAGVVPIANAADGGGSIRIPASACGLVGLRPSRGRLPHSQAGEPFVGAVTDGVLTRSVRDTSLFMAEAEKQHRHRKLAPIGLVEQPLDRPLRIGAVIDALPGIEVDEATRRAFDANLALLESLGHRVEPIEAPGGEQFADDFVTFWTMLGFLASVTSKRLTDRTFEKALLTDFTKGLARDFRRSMAAAPAAIRRLRRSRVTSTDLFDDIDLMATPTVGALPPPIGHLGTDLSYDVLLPRVREWVCFTPHANATGGPSISLPVGHDDATDLPIGMMFGADHGQEGLLLELALQIEEASPWRQIWRKGRAATTDR